MIEIVPMYRVLCDSCDASAQDGTDFFAWAEEDQARDDATEAGWQVIDGKDYCDVCWEWDEQSDQPKAKTSTGEGGQ